MSSAKLSNPERRKQRPNAREGAADVSVASASPAPGESRTPLLQRVGALGFAGSLLLWAAFPPLGWWPLAWLAPIPWLQLIQQEQLSGRHPYRTLWLAGCAFWLGVLHWLRLPHPATSIGWVALSCYLAVYLPLFVALCRVAVHRLRWPLILAAPMVWTGLELAQAHLLTGFNMAALGNSQYRWIALIQIADLGGNYAVGFVVVFVAACLARMAPSQHRRLALWPLAPLALMLGVVLGYGVMRQSDGAGRPGPRIALLQGSVDTELKHDPARQAQIQEQYSSLSLQALREKPRPDLLVWPETMYRNPLLVCSADVKPPDEWHGSAEEFKAELARRQNAISEDARWLQVPLLLGIDAAHYGPGTMERYNSAQFIADDGTLGPRYDKMHPVLFGEYVPFARQFPWLCQLSPIGAGIDCGVKTPAFEVAGARLAANICYESCLPHLIRNQVAELRGAGREPDVLVNLTNDGWFWGSSELDLHLMCGVLRAVECRKPFLVAANTGFSAWIDADGHILKQGPRRDQEVVIADVRLDERMSRYVNWGDWPAGLCLAGCACFAFAGWRERRKGTA
jgi:apolipoprotein N-acyltransferase